MGRRRKRAVRADLGNPNVPLGLDNLDDPGWQGWGLGRSASGVRVTERTALGYPAVWRAVSLIAGDVAKLSLVVYRTTGAGRAADRGHPAYRLVRSKANPYLLAYHFKRVIQTHALIRGNGYAYIDRDGGGRPVGLHVLDSRAVAPVREGGQVYYEFEPAPGERTVLIPAADMFHIHGLGDDGVAGYPALEILRDSIGAALAARDYGARNFRNSARPGGVIKHPGKLSAEARKNMRESWERLHKGVENAHKIAILEEGSEFAPLAASAREAQLLESREFDSREIANIFGVPAHKLGDPSKVAYNSLGEENQSYYNDTLSHWLGQWSAEASEKLLSEPEKAAESHVIDFDYREVQRANLQTLTTYATAACGKWASVDEVRDLFGDNPLPGGKGEWKDPPAPAADKPAAPPASDPPPTRKLDGLRAVVEDTARRMAKRITAHAARLGARWTISEAEEHDKVLGEAFAPVMLACREAGVKWLDEIDPETYGRSFRAQVAASIIECGHDRLSLADDAIVAGHASRAADELTRAGQ